jgi:hypothetical protein
MPGWSQPNGATLSFTPADLDPLHHLSDVPLEEGVLDNLCESTSSDSGYVDLEYLEGIRSQRLQRRTDAWAYPGDLLRCIEGKHVIELKNSRSLPPDELDRRWIAEFRMSEAGFLELLEFVIPHLELSVSQNLLYASVCSFGMHSLQYGPNSTSCAWSHLKTMKSPRSCARWRGRSHLEQAAVQEDVHRAALQRRCALRPISYQRQRGLVRRSVWKLPSDADARGDRVDVSGHGLRYYEGPGRALVAAAQQHLTAIRVGGKCVACM